MSDHERTRLRVVEPEPLTTAQAITSFKCSWPGCEHGPCELVEDSAGVERLACPEHVALARHARHPIVIDPPPAAALHELAAALETVGHSDEWAAGWRACHEILLVERAEAYTSGFERGRLAHTPRTLPLWVPLVATGVAIAAFVLGVMLA